MSASGYCESGKWRSIIKWLLDTEWLLCAGAVAFLLASGCSKVSGVSAQLDRLPPNLTFSEVGSEVRAFPKLSPDEISEVNAYAHDERKAVGPRSVAARLLVANGQYREIIGLSQSQQSSLRAEAYFGCFHQQAQFLLECFRREPTSHNRYLIAGRMPMASNVQEAKEILDLWLRESDARVAYGLFLSQLGSDGEDRVMNEYIESQLISILGALEGHQLEAVLKRLAASFHRTIGTEKIIAHNLAQYLGILVRLNEDGVREAALLAGNYIR